MRIVKLNIAEEQVEQVPEIDPSTPPLFTKTSLREKVGFSGKVAVQIVYTTRAQAIQSMLSANGRIYRNSIQIQNKQKHPSLPYPSVPI